MIMFLWVGANTPAQWMNDVFNVNAPHQLDPTLADLPQNDNPTSERVRSIVAQVSIAIVIFYDEGVKQLVMLLIS